MSAENNKNGLCPHCQSQVDPLRAPAVSVVGGRIVHFCSAVCRERHLERITEPDTERDSFSSSEPPDSSTFDALKPSDEEMDSEAQRKDREAVLEDEAGDEAAESHLENFEPSKKETPEKRGRSALLRNQLLLLGLSAAVAAAAIWARQTGESTIGQLAVAAGAFLLAVVGTFRQRREGLTRVLESWAVPLGAAAVVLSHGFGGLGVSRTTLVGAAVLLVDQLGRTLELAGRIRSRILPALEGRSDVSIPGSWKDNSPVARKLRWLTVPLEWGRYPAAAALGAGLVLWGKAGLSDGIVAGAIALLGLSPRALRMATGDAHLSVGLRHLAAGIFVRDAHVVDRIADCRTVALMASKTVFDGEARIMDLKLTSEADESTVLPLLAGLNAEAPGRIAAGIRHWLLGLGVTSPAQMRRVEKVPKLGLRGEMNGREVFSGDRRLLLSNHISTSPLEDHAHRIEQTGRRAVFVGVEDSVVACFAVENPISVHAAPAVVTIRALGLEPVLVTSAGVDAANGLAGRLGIDIVEFDTCETEVGAVIHRLEQAGDETVLVGRGNAFEDDTATAAAAIALGHRDQTNAGIVVPDDNIARVPVILDACHRARKSVMNNIAVSCSCVGLGLILALGWGFPSSVAVAAALSSFAGVFATINGPYPTIQRVWSLPSRWLTRLKRTEAT